MWEKIRKTVSGALNSRVCKATIDLSFNAIQVAYWGSNAIYTGMREVFPDRAQAGILHWLDAALILYSGQQATKKFVLDAHGGQKDASPQDWHAHVSHAFFWLGTYLYTNGSMALQDDTEQNQAHWFYAFGYFLWMASVLKNSTLDAEHSLLDFRKSLKESPKDTAVMLGCLFAIAELYVISTPREVGEYDKDVSTVLSALMAASFVGPTIASGKDLFKSFTCARDAEQQLPVQAPAAEVPESPANRRTMLNI